MNLLRFRRTLSELLELTWPVYIAQLAVLINGLIDTVMAGRIDALELAAVGVGSSIVITIFVSANGILLALTPIVAHLYGAGRRNEIGEQVRQSFWVAVGIFVLALFLLKHPEPFFWLSDLRPELESRVRLYLEYSAWSMPTILLFRVFSGLATGIGRPRAVMVLNLLGLALKLPLNFILMFGYWGVSAHGGAGAAMATAYVNVIIAALAWWWCWREPMYAEYSLFSRFNGPSLKHIVEFLKLGLPIGATFFVDISAFTFMALFVARLGPLASAAHQIAANLVTLSFQFPLALGNAAAVLAGRAIGGGIPSQAKYAGGISIAASLCSAVFVALFLWLCAPLVASWYTSDVAVQTVAIPLIGLVALYHLSDALQATTVNVLRGYKITTLPMLVYALALWGIGLGGGYVLALTDRLMPRLGIAGFWIASACSLAVAGVIVFLYFIKIAQRFTKIAE